MSFAEYVKNGFPVQRIQEPTGAEISDFAKQVQRAYRFVYVGDQPVHHDVTKDMRQFRPDVCCEHDWVNDGIFGNHCHKCGATCIRAADGTIEEYDNGAFAPESAY